MTPLRRIGVSKRKQRARNYNLALARLSFLSRVKKMSAEEINYCITEITRLRDERTPIMVAAMEELVAEAKEKNRRIVTP